MYCGWGKAFLCMVKTSFLGDFPWKSMPISPCCEHWVLLTWWEALLTRKSQDSYEVVLISLIYRCRLEGSWNRLWQRSRTPGGATLAGRHVKSDDFSSNSWVAMVSAIYCPDWLAQGHAGTLCSSQGLNKGCRLLSSGPDFRFSFPTSTGLSPGFIPIFHPLQVFALPQILLTCPAFVFPSIANTLKYPLDKAFLLWFHLLWLFLITYRLPKGIRLNWGASWD